MAPETTRSVATQDTANKVTAGSLGKRLLGDRCLRVVAVHGGAWDIPKFLWKDTIKGVKEAAIKGFKILNAGGSAVDAVEAAVVIMEENPVFDAGRGSVLTSAGTIEVSSLIMEGGQLRAGAVAAAHNLLTPVVVARRVMEDTPHVMLAGEGATAFAKSVGVLQRPHEDLVTPEARRQLEEYRRYVSAVSKLFNEAECFLPDGPHDTVGCVAVDDEGLTACATSTGGITGQLPGRVGDSPQIGSGGYADNSAGAVSTTGHGESIARVGLAHHVIHNLRQGLNAHAAGSAALQYMPTRVGGRGGCVVVTPAGDVAAPYTTARMPWAYVKKGILHWGMNPGEHSHEPVSL